MTSEKDNFQYVKGIKNKVMKLFLEKDTGMTDCEFVFPNKEKLNDIRNSISEVRQCIRFLSMSGEEFAKGPAISDTILSVDEKLAISVNLHSPGACRMPEGLCLLRKCRLPRVKLRNKFYNPINTSFVHSYDFNVKNTSWKVKNSSVANGSSHKYIKLELMLVSYGGKATGKCSAHVEMKILPTKKNCSPKQIDFKETFQVGGSNLINPFMVEYDELFGNKSKFLNEDGSFLVEISVELIAEPEDDIIYPNAK